MNEKLNQWLGQCALAPGMFGCGVCLPDGNCVSHDFGDIFPQATFNEALRSLDNSLPAIFAHGLAPRWLTWTFERGQMRVALHPDGVLLTLAVEPNTPAAQNLDLFTEEFMALNLKN
jgi:hypothetical protein